MRSSTDNILFPDFAKAVFIEPRLQLCRIGPCELRFLSFPIYHDDIFGIKIVEEGA
jgi:hypothetical protein